MIDFSRDEDTVFWICFAVVAGLLILWLSWSAEGAPLPKGPKKLVIDASTEWVCTRYESLGSRGTGCRPALEIAWYILRNGPVEDPPLVPGGDQ